VLLRTIEVRAAVRGIVFLSSAPGVLFWLSHRSAGDDGAGAADKSGGAVKGGGKSGGGKAPRGKTGRLHRLVVSASAARGRSGAVVDSDDESDEGEAAVAGGDGGSQVVLDSKAWKWWVDDPQGRYLAGYGDHEWSVFWPDTGKVVSQHSGRRCVLASVPPSLSLSRTDAIFATLPPTCTCRSSRSAACARLVGFARML
jgi:hypothetical protein